MVTRRDAPWKREELINALLSHSKNQRVSTRRDRLRVPFSTKYNNRYKTNEIVSQTDAKREDTDCTRGARFSWYQLIFRMITR